MKTEKDWFSNDTFLVTELDYIVRAIAIMAVVLTAFYVFLT